MPVAEYRMVVTPHRIPVADIKRNKPSPFQIIDNTSFETTVEGTEMANGIRRILLPHKKDDDPPATAFGLFLGYTLKMNEADYSLPVKQFKKRWLSVWNMTLLAMLHISKRNWKKRLATSLVLCLRPSPE